MFKRFNEDARKLLLTWAAEEVSRRGDRRLGTDHFLLGLLHDPTSECTRALGVDLEAAQAAEDVLDRAALAAVGINVGSFGSVPAFEPSRRLPPLTSGAREVMKRAIQEARFTGARRIEPRHFLLVLLSCRRPDPAAELLHALGVEAEAVRARLLEPVVEGTE